jgi:hypothetical protein
MHAEQINRAQGLHGMMTIILADLYFIGTNINIEMFFCLLIKTVFEDVNGFGSWDRRWCFLNNYNISYWKYPEDEYRQTPIGIVNLTKCVSETPIVLLPRDVCARKFTIELNVIDEHQTEQAGLDGQKIKTYRLSADTKDQANDWCTNMNYALANLKLWNSKNTVTSAASAQSSAMRK